MSCEQPVNCKHRLPRARTSVASCAVCLSPMEILESMAGVAINKILWTLHLSYRASAMDAQGLSRKQQCCYLETLRYAGRRSAIYLLLEGFSIFCGDGREKIENY